MSAVASLEAVLRMNTDEYQAGANRATSATGRLQAEVNGGARAMQQMGGAADGNLRSIMRLSGGLGDMGALLAKGTALVGSFFAGWEMGKKIGDWLWPMLLNMNAKMEESGESTRKFRKEMEAASKLSLQKLAGEAAALNKQLDEAEKHMRGLGAGIGAINSAKNELRDSEIDAMPEGLEKEQAKAKQKLGVAIAKIDVDKTDAEENLRRAKLKGDEGAADQARFTMLSFDDREKAALNRYNNEMKTAQDNEDAKNKSDKTKGVTATAPILNVPGVNTDSLARIGGLVGAAVNPEMRKMQGEDMRAAVRHLANIERNTDEMAGD